MILTLTANPSLDRTIDLAGALARGAVQRARGVAEQPGGKGVNVSRALIASGLDTIALLPGRLDDPMPRTRPPSGSRWTTWTSTAACARTSR